MKRILIGALIGPALFGLSACNNDNNTAPLAGAFRVVNAVSDSDKVTASATSGISNTDQTAFGSASSIVQVPVGGYNVQVANDGNAFETVDNVKIDHNNLTTLYATGSIATPGGFSIEENLNAPSSGDFTFQFVNATTQTATGTLTIYLVPSGGSLSSTQPAVAAVKAGAGSDTASIKAGTYEIVVTDGATTLFDSGSTGIALPDPNSNVIQIGAIDANTAQASKNNGSKITLVITDNNGGETQHFNGGG